MKRETILGGPSHQAEPFPKGWEFQAERSFRSLEETNSDDMNCRGTKPCGKEPWEPLGAEKSYWLTIIKKVGTSVLESHAPGFCQQPHELGRGLKLQRSAQKLDDLEFRLGIAWAKKPDNPVSTSTKPVIITSR